MAQCHIWLTCWVYKKVLLKLRIYISLKVAFLLHRTEWNCCDGNCMTGKVENIYYSVLYKKMFANFKQQWFVFPLCRRTAPCHPHGWLLIHGGSTLWNIEGYSSSVKGAPENLTLRIKPSTQNGTCFFLLFYWPKASNVATSDFKWPEKYHPPCAQEESYVWCEGQSLPLGKARTGEALANGEGGCWALYNFLYRLQSSGPILRVSQHGRNSKEWES